MFSRVAIIGLGLIGGSVGLALRKARASREVVGYDLGRGVSERAYRIGAIDQAYEVLADAVRGADLVVLATPVGAMHTLLQSIAPLVSPGTVVTDVASTKAQVMRWAEELLPESVFFVGGHPMTGKEISGVEAADANLFHNRIYCLTPVLQTQQKAINKIVSLIEVLGARVRFLDPIEHDRQVAGVSHLPFLASLALVHTVAGDASWGEASLLAANGFRDMSRLAGGNPEMYRDICVTNSETIVQWLDKYIAMLTQLRDRVSAQDNQLNETFVEVQSLRLQWLSSQDMPVLPSSEE